MSYFLGFLEVMRKTIQLSFFTILIFIRPVITFTFGIFSGFSLFGFLFCLLFKREEQQVMWTLFGAGITTSLIITLYDALLSFLAPDDMVLITER